MNKLDAALVASALEAAGFSLIDSANDADVVLINTCSVRDHAEQRVLSHLGHLKHIKKSRPGMMVGVIGCMAQRLGEQLLEHDTVDLVCGPAQIPQIPQLLARALHSPPYKLLLSRREFGTDRLKSKSRLWKNSNRPTVSRTNNCRAKPSFAPCEAATISARTASSLLSAARKSADRPPP